jgi:hypothetical protein
MWRTSFRLARTTDDDIEEKLQSGAPGTIRNVWPLPSEGSGLIPEAREQVGAIRHEICRN